MAKKPASQGPRKKVKKRGTAKASRKKLAVLRHAKLTDTYPLKDGGSLKYEKAKLPMVPPKRVKRKGEKK